jgi:hypothetical protein
MKGVSVNPSFFMGAICTTFAAYMMFSVGISGLPHLSKRSSSSWNLPKATWLDRGGWRSIRKACFTVQHSI